MGWTLNGSQIYVVFKVIVVCATSTGALNIQFVVVFFVFLSKMYYISAVTFQ